MNRSKFVPTLGMTWKDFKVLARDRGTLITLFVVPMVFIFAFTAAFGEEGDPEEQLIAVPVVDLDAGSERSQELIAALNAAGGVRVEPFGQDEAQASLDRVRSPGC